MLPGDLSSSSHLPLVRAPDYSSEPSRARLAVPFACSTRAANAAAFTPADWGRNRNLARTGPQSQYSNGPDMKRAVPWFCRGDKAACGIPRRAAPRGQPVALAFSSLTSPDAASEARREKVGGAGKNLRNSVWMFMVVGVSAFREVRRPAFTDWHSGFSRSGSRDALQLGTW